MVETAVQEEGFLFHEECPSCGSSDANGVYADGHKYCFSCRAYTPSKDEPSTVPPATNEHGLIPVMPSSIAKRRLSMETCARFGYGVGQYHGQVVQVATYFENNERVAQHLRFQNKDFRWIGDTSSLELFGQNRWKDGGKRVVVTEGEIDCLSVSQALGNKWPVVSLPNGAAGALKSIRHHLEWLEHFEEVVIWFDNDEPGRAAVSLVAPLFTPGKVRVVTTTFGAKDANDLLKMSREEEICRLIFEAPSYRPDGILNGTELEGRIMDYFKDVEGSRGYETPYPLLNQHLQNLRRGEITTIAAGTGTGKSTFVAELAYDLLMRHKCKIGYVALEENPTRTSLRMMSLHLGVPLHLKKEEIDENTYRNAFLDTLGSGRFYLYDHFGSLESDNLLSKLRFLATGLGCDFIILDHISIVVSGIEDGDERRIIDNLMTKLRSLVEQTGVGIIAICHLKKKSDGYKAHEEGGRVILDDLRGSGSLKQLSDNVIGMERDQQSKTAANITVLRVLKCRYTGDTGVADALMFDKESGRISVWSDFHAAGVVPPSVDERSPF